MFTVCVHVTVSPASPDSQRTRDVVTVTVHDELSWRQRCENKGTIRTNLFDITLCFCENNSE